MVAPTTASALRPAHCLAGYRPRRFSGHGRRSLYCLLTPPEFETSDWGAVVNGSLTGRGLLTRDSESSSAVLRGPAGTVAFPLGPRSLSHETGNAGDEARNLESLYGRRVTESPQGLSLSGFSVNRKDAKGSRQMVGSSDVTLFVTIASSRMGGPRALAWIFTPGNALT